MTSDIKKYVLLKTVVSYFLDENDKSQGDFDKAWIIAFRALVDIGFNISFEPLTVRLPLNPNQTVTLPPDYITWTKIGVLNSSNEISTLKVNKSLTNFRDNNPNRLSDLQPDINVTDVSSIAFNPYFINYYYNNYYTPMFGLGNGLVQFGECKVDEAHNVIILGPTYSYPDLMLEYISSPQRNGDYQIETVAQEAVIAFIAWKFKVGTEQGYYARLREARRKLQPIRLQVINQSIRENHGFKLKS